MPELPGLSDKHNLVEDSVDELVQGKCYFFLDLSLSLNVKTTAKCGLLGSCFPGTFDNMCILINRELNQQSTITLLNTFYRRNISWNQMNWDSATCITCYTDYYQRLTLKSCLTNLEKTPQNRSQQLPAPYKRVIDGLKQNWQPTIWREKTLVTMKLWRITSRLDVIQLTLTLTMTAAVGAKRQSLSTTVLFKTTITRTIMPRLLKSKVATTNKWNFLIYSFKHNVVQKQLQPWLT